MDNYLEQLELEIQEKPINWRDFFEKIIRYWKWFVISALIAIIGGYIYGRMQPDVYELKTSVLIIDQARSGQMNEMSVLRQLNDVGLGSRSSSAVNNEDQVLKSTVLMKRVVKQLELQTTYTQRTFLKTVELYTNSPLYVHMDSITLCQLTSTLQLSFIPDNGHLSIEGQYKGEEFSMDIKQLPAIISTPAGTVYVQLRPGSKIPEKSIDVSIQDPLRTAKAYAKGNLSTEVAKMVDVIDISLKTSNVQKGKDILTTLTVLYNQDASEQNNLSTNNTARFIETRLKLLSEELSTVEREVENYKQANELTDIDEDAKMYLAKTSVFDQRQIDVEMQQNLVKFVDDFIKNPSNKSEAIPNLGLSDAGLVGMIQRYNELVMTYDRIAVGTSDENPTLKTLMFQLNSTRKAIQTSITNNRKGLQITNKDLSAQNSKMQSKIKGVPRKEREFLEIKRQQQVKATLYLFLLQKREEASLNMAVTVPKGRVLNTPDDATVVGPHRNIIMVVFLLIGLIIPGLIIYILSLVNNKIQNREDVEKRSKIPIISELGRNENDSIIIDNRPNASSNSELFRLLRTKIQLILDNPSEKVVLITSTMSGEGKTFVGINLALMLSLADKKVLLIGMDLRKPMLRKYFNLKSKDGITGYLSGQITDYQSLIHTSTEYPTLNILPAGVIPPNPTELLMKERLIDLLSELKEQYDYIIIDSAPVGAVSDTFLIDRISDITLYVCRARYTDKRNIEYVNRIENEKSLKRLYFIVNDVDLEANTYSYHRNTGYGYGYGYGKRPKGVDA